MKLIPTLTRKHILTIAVVAIAAIALTQLYTMRGTSNDLGAVVIGGVSTTNPPKIPVCVASTAPYIVVTSPNGGEQYSAGQQVDVAWKTCNVPATGRLAIDIIQGSGTGEPFPLVSGLQAGDGAATVTMPSITNWPAMTYGTNFKIKVRYVGRGLEDQSDKAFSISMVQVVMGTTTATHTSSPTGEVTSVTYNIPLKITPMGQNIYLKQSAWQSNSVQASHAFAYVFQTSANPLVSDVLSSSVPVLTSSDATVEGTAFRVEDATTKNFNLTIVLTSPNTRNSNYRVALKQLQWFTSAAMLAQQSYKMNLLPATSYTTPYQYINN